MTIPHHFLYNNDAPQRSRPSTHEIYIQVCELIANRATCERAQVGAIITLQRRIISSGYNGPLFGDCNNKCDVTQKCNHAVHAEANAIANAARLGIKLMGATLYCSYAPCYECAKMIIQSDIMEVYYLKTYSTNPGIDLLLQAKVPVTQVKL